jgi:hypothetical protein
VKAKFYFSLMRYVYDPLSQEFVNIGVVIYSPEIAFLRATFTTRYRRISKMFGHIDGASFRALSRYIDNQIAILSDEMNKGLLFKDSKKDLQSILGEILPADEGSIRFVAGGVGVTEDPSKSLETLYQRYVSRYENPNDTLQRDEDDVWKSFQDPLRTKRVYTQLVPKKITASDYEYLFKRSWKNGKWHLFEPVSFDLADESAILEKASKWVGRSSSLSDSSDEFKLIFLLGKPTDQKLMPAYQKARNLLSAKIAVERDFFQEDDATQFADQLEKEFCEHELESQN